MFLSNTSEKEPKRSNPSHNSIVTDSNPIGELKATIFPLVNFNSIGGWKTIDPSPPPPPRRTPNISGELRTLAAFGGVA